MTAHSDTAVYLDVIPLIRAHKSTSDTSRAILAVDHVLTIFAPADVLRATLVAALDALDAATAVEA